MSREAFSMPIRTYKTYKKAKKIIDGLSEGNYKWSIMCTDDGRFFPHIAYPITNAPFSHFYFTEQGCCVTVEVS